MFQGGVWIIERHRSTSQTIAEGYGTPQIRRRAIIIDLKGMKAEPPPQTHADGDNRKLMTHRHPKWETVRDAIADLPCKPNAHLPNGDYLHIASHPTPISLDQWAHANGVTLDFSRPGKPTDNALIESFNGRLRQECLNESWFLSLDDAREKVDIWRTDYNEHRPHSALGNLAPNEFASIGRVNQAG